MLYSRAISSQSRLVKLLYAAGDASEDDARAEAFAAVMRHLQTLSPSALDLELRTLSADEDEGRQLGLALTFFDLQARDVTPTVTPAVTPMAAPIGTLHLRLLTEYYTGCCPGVLRPADRPPPY